MKPKGRRLTSYKTARSGEGRTSTPSGHSCAARTRTGIMATSYTVETITSSPRTNTCEDVCGREGGN